VNCPKEDYNPKASSIKCTTTLSPQNSSETHFVSYARRSYKQTNESNRKTLY
jgi:hypothetical protein